MTTVDISTLHEIDDLLSLLEADTPVILTKMNKPFAKLIPVEPANLPNMERVPILHSGMWMSDDFDAKLPREFWADKL